MSEISCVLTARNLGSAQSPFCSINNCFRDRFSPFLSSSAIRTLSDCREHARWPSPCFSQVLILKVVKVRCFHTLLQVLMALLTSPTQFLFRGSTRRGLRCFLMEQEGQWPKSDSCPLLAWRWKWPRRVCLLTARPSANISSPSRSCWRCCAWIASKYGYLCTPERAM